VKSTKNFVKLMIKTINLCFSMEKYYIYELVNSLAMNKFVNCKSIYNNDEIYFERALINVVSIKNLITPLDKTNIDIYTHQNLFQLVFVQKGEGKLLLQDKSIEIKPNVFFTLPSNLFYSFIVSSQTKGWLLSFNELALEELIKKEKNLVFVLDKFQIHNLIENKPEINHINFIVSEIVENFFKRKDNKGLALKAYTEMLMVFLYDLIKKDIKIKSAKEIKIYRRFKILINDLNKLSVNSVRSFSQKLNVTESQLRRVCKKNTGKTPKQLIIEKRIETIKNALHNIDWSIKQISINLGYENYNWFLTFFKKYTGITPKEYRQKYLV